MTLAAGIWLEGVNFAIGSGLAAGRTAAAAAAKGDSSTRALSAYRKDLEAGFVLQDHKRLRGAPGLVLSDRVQRQYPGMVADLVVFDPATVTDVATFEQPNRYSTGIRHVFVNGKTVVANGTITNERPGRALRGPGYRGR